LSLYLSVILNYSVIMNKLFTNLLLPLSAIIFAFNLYGQHDHSKCGTNEELNKLYESDPGLRKIMEKAFSTNYQVEKSGEDTTLYIIPIVFHVLHENGTERLSESQIISHVDALNQQFRNEFVSHSNNYPTFDSLRADSYIEFRLATIDPQGNCTNGIDYIYTKETNIGENESKYNQWNRSKYLNIWTVKTFKDRPTLLGFSMFPDAVVGSNFYMDGVILKSAEIDGFSTTLTHEIGHYLSLSHPWGNNNDPEVACGDDGIDDTPMTQGYQSICPFPSLSYSRICEAPFFNSYMTFDSLRTTSGVNDITPIDSSDYIYVQPMEAVGVSANTVADSIFEFNNWGIGGVDQDTVYSNQLGSIDLNKYYETKLCVTGNNLMDVTNVIFKAQRSDDGVKSIAIRSSIDNFSSNIPVTTNNGNITKVKSNTVYIEPDTTRFFKLTANISNITDISNNDTITLRIYGWNAETTNGTFAVDSLFLSGKRGAIENIENYMDYANCPKMFTKGQIAKMRSTLTSSISSRSNLVSTSNHTQTGINTTVTCAPIAEFYSNNQFVCQGSQIKFYDRSYNGPVENRTWTFEGGTPATSTDQDPTVQFDSPGYKMVTLTVSNSAGSDEITKSDYIYIGHNYGEVVGPQQFSLDDGKEWWFVVDNPESNYAKFQIAEGVGYDNTNCFKLNNYRDLSDLEISSQDKFYYSRLGGNKDAIITPSIDLSHSSGLSFKFKYSYATDGTTVTEVNNDEVDITESIRIYKSTNCGQTWGSPLSTIDGGDLLTAGFAGNVDYAPSSNLLWKEFSKTFTSSSSDNKVRFKIEFESSDVSNNLYIDDIFIDGILGLPSEIADLDLNIYPNPLNTNQEINVSFRAGKNPIELTLRNTQGQVVYNKTIETTNAEVNHTLNLDSKLSSSCYFLEVRNGEFKTVKKVVVL
jgi:PKD repeat protein